MAAAWPENPNTATDPFRCTRCGACLAVCPTYRVLARETESPRGRLALARAYIEAALPPSPRAAELVYRCALCAACNAACPTGLEVDTILQGLRARLAGEGLLPESLQRLRSAVGASGNILGEAQQARELWLEQGIGEEAGRHAADTVYFVGCVASLFPSSYPIPQQTLRLLQAAGQPVTLLGGAEWCCGYPLALSGCEDALPAIARDLVGRVVALGARRVVTSCPSCYHTWRHIYPRLVPEMPLEVLHASEVLLHAVQRGDLRLQPLPDQAVTYHDPCDLGRRSGLYDPPRDLIRSIPGLRLMEMRDRRDGALCCGGGGNLESVAPGLVEQAATRRLQQAIETGAPTLVTACPQCRRTLAGAARRERARLRVLDVSELLGKAVSE
ncbi:MAG: (Fe-S)-binding protein [Anaerolineae bacterium]|nr:(Fe-S)-binding protein [Anaerolineae bacterium]